MPDKNLDAEFKRAFIASEAARKRKEVRSKIVGGLLVVVAIVAFIIYAGTRTVNQTSDSNQDATAAQTPVLTRLLPKCPPDWNGSCDAEVFKDVWMQVDRSDGKITMVDTASLKRLAGLAMADIYTSSPDAPFDPNNVMVLSFDCAGHYQNTAIPSQFDAQPGSVAAKIAALACAKAQN